MHQAKASQRVPRTPEGKTPPHALVSAPIDLPPADNSGVEHSDSAAGLERERERVAAAQRGEDLAWRELFEEYYPRLYGFMRARVGEDALAEDLAAETFVDAYRGLPRFSWRGRPFGAWLFKVARNRLRMHYRGEAARPSTTADQAPESASGSGHELSFEIEEVLTRLPAEYRDAIELRYVMGLTGAEAAAAMGRSHGGFRMLLHRAVRAFRDEFSLDDA